MRLFPYAARPIRSRGEPDGRLPQECPHSFLPYSPALPLPQASRTDYTTRKQSPRLPRPLCRRTANRRLRRSPPCRSPHFSEHIRKNGGQAWHTRFRRKQKSRRKNPANRAIPAAKSRKPSDSSRPYCAAGVPLVMRNILPRFFSSGKNSSAPSSRYPVCDSFSK